MEAMEMEPAASAGMGIVGMLLILLLVLCAIGSLICMIMVWVRAFQAGDTGLGIAMVVLFFVGGLGGLLTFILGWVKASEWDTRNLMKWWTILVVLAIVLFVVFIVTVGLAVFMSMPAEQPGMEIDMQEFENLDFDFDAPQQ